VNALERVCVVYLRQGKHLNEQDEFGKSEFRDMMKVDRRLLSLGMCLSCRYTTSSLLSR
jgi:hypothetical protein